MVRVLRPKPDAGSVRLPETSTLGLSRWDFQPLLPPAVVGRLRHANHARCGRSISIGWRSRSGRRRTIAAGENACGGLQDFRRLCEAGAIDFAQPSVTKIGGITEVRKIVALAEAFGVRVVPHCAYFGPGYLASVHIAATLAEAVPLERLFMDLQTSPFPPYTDAAGGKVPVPQSPGLGCDPSAELIDRYRTHPPTVTR